MLSDFTLDVCISMKDDMEVYRGSENTTNQLVLVKAGWEYDSISQLQREHDILTGPLATCTGVPTIVHTVNKNGWMVLVERPFGIPLDGCVALNPPNAEMLRDWASQAGRILKQVHSLGVLHRDIKPGTYVLVASRHLTPQCPDNMIISREDGRLYLINFGYARKKSKQRANVYWDRYFVGAPAWAAPTAVATESAGKYEYDFEALCLTFYSLEIGIDKYLECEPSLEKDSRKLRTTSPIVEFICDLWNQAPSSAEDRV